MNRKKRFTAAVFALFLLFLLFSRGTASAANKALSLVLALVSARGALATAEGIS